MNKKTLIFAAFIALGLAFAVSAQDKPAAGAKKSAADIEKEKALANPYPNDYGPDHLDPEVLKAYPKEIQDGYKTLLGDAKKKNCQTCHTAARPLNSRFVQPEAKNDPVARKAAVEKLKKEQPELFKDKSVWEVDEGIWSRYVKRMMGKPGCNIAGPDGKKIFEFLVYDSMHRKVGASASAWAAHRKSLVEKLKTEKPERYKELAAQNDL